MGFVLDFGRGYLDAYCATAICTNWAFSRKGRGPNNETVSPAFGACRFLHFSLPDLVSIQN